MSLKSKITYIILLCLLWLSVPAFAWAQAKVIVQTDTTVAEIGSRIKLNIEVQGVATNEQLIWAAIPKELDGLEVVESSEIDTIANNDKLSFSQQLQLTAFDSGDYKIPSFEFQLLQKNGNVQKILADSIKIRINTIDVDTTAEYKPIFGIAEIKTTWKDYLHLILGGILLIGLSAFTIYYLRKNKGTLIPKISKLPPETDYEKALRLLRELQEKNYPASGKIKEFYSELSDIVRIYIESRFALPAMEQTTGELLQSAKRTPVLKRNRTELKQILRTADLVKFAKEKPLLPEMDNAMAAAIDFVEKTKLKEEEVTANE